MKWPVHVGKQLIGIAQFFTTQLDRGSLRFPTPTLLCLQVQPIDSARNLPGPNEVAPTARESLRIPYSDHSLFSGGVTEPQFFGQFHPISPGVDRMVCSRISCYVQNEAISGRFASECSPDRSLPA